MFHIRREFIAQAQRVVVVTLGVALFVLLFLRFLLFSVAIRSPSMEPVLSPNNRVFVTPLVGGRSEVPVLWAELPTLWAVRRGDLVLVEARKVNDIPRIITQLDALVSFATFRYFSLNNPRFLTSRSAAVARVAALPGERVYMKDNVLYVRPPEANAFLTEFELSPRKYNTIVKPLPNGWNSRIGVAGDFPEILLGTDEYFLLCDNRSSSIDSRIWGPVRSSAILGKLWFRYFPPDKIGRL
jgi:signal peptidase I